MGPLPQLIDEIAATGANAVRLLPDPDVTAGEMDALLARAHQHEMITYISPCLSGCNLDREDYLNWFSNPDMRQTLGRHERNLVIDALAEVDFDDPTRWEGAARHAISRIREAGYTSPMCIMSNQFGRDLTTTLERGESIAASDPLRNTMLCWQAYWGDSGYYQRKHGMSLHAAFERLSTLPFHVQAGILRFTDGSEEMDYSAVMADAEQFQIGWMWWHWCDFPNRLTDNRRLDGLNALGHTVIETDPNSIQNTSRRACF
jgi:hypothetical protein